MRAQKAFTTTITSVTAISADCLAFRRVLAIYSDRTRFAFHLEMELCCFWRFSALRLIGVTGVGGLPLDDCWLCSPSAFLAALLVSQAGSIDRQQH